MKKNSLFKTPILFIIFNRPETEKRVFEQIRRIKPKYLYVAADGPRKGKEGENEKCLEARRIVDEGVNWPCEVKKLYRKKNLGCKLAVSGAIDWFFDNVEAGIILEDDCLPDISFFRYCEELLDKYLVDRNVMMISGFNYIGQFCFSKNSYFFSNIGSIWGWATWRRAWKLNLVNESHEKYSKHINEIKSNFQDSFLFNIYYPDFNEAFNGEINTWDYQWLLSIWKYNSKVIVPSVNLVSNIGSGVMGTHGTYNIFSRNHSKKIIFPLNFLNNNLRTNYYDYVSSFLMKSKVVSFLSKVIYYLNLVINPVSWRNIEYFDKGWKKRIKYMSLYISKNESVCDLGSGKMWLKELLKYSNKYYPVDYIKRDFNTIVCDFNKREFPKISADVAFVSGCLEYIENPKWFVKNIAKNYKKCILSYCVLDDISNILTRRSMSWVNNFSEKDIIDLFRKNNMILVTENMSIKNNRIFVFKNNE